MVGSLRQGLAEGLSRNWWTLLVRGLAAIAFGIMTFVMAGITLAVLVMLFGAYAVFDGAVAVWAALGSRKNNPSWWMLLLAGLVGIGLGLLTFVTPSITALVLLFFIALWAIAKGVLEIVTAIRLRKEIEGEWRLVVAGLASIGFGLVVLSRPGAGALAILWLIGAYAMLFGVLLVLLAFRARGFAKRLATA